MKFINLYDYHSRPEELADYDRRYDVTLYHFWRENLESFSGEKIEDYIDLGLTHITNDASLSIRFAQHFNKAFPEGEEAIAKDAGYAYSYATQVIKERFKAGEDAIATAPRLAWRYATDIIKGRFFKGEKAISSNSYFMKEYLTYLEKNNIPHEDITL